MTSRRASDAPTTPEEATQINLSLRDGGDLECIAQRSKHLAKDIEKEYASIPPKNASHLDESIPARFMPVQWIRCERACIRRDNRKVPPYPNLPPLSTEPAVPNHSPHIYEPEIVSRPTQVFSMKPSAIFRRKNFRDRHGHCRKIQADRVNNDSVGYEQRNGGNVSDSFTDGPHTVSMTPIQVESNVITAPFGQSDRMIPPCRNYYILVHAEPRSKKNDMTFPSVPTAPVTSADVMELLVVSGVEEEGNDELITDEMSDENGTIPEAVLRRSYSCTGITT